MAHPEGTRPRLERALVLLQQAQPADALELLLELLGEFPTDFDTLNLAGVAATRIGNARAAADYLQRAVAVRPGHAGAQNNLGIALRLLGDSEGAAQAYGRAVELEPRYPAARTNLAAALSDLRRYDEALESVDASLTLRSGHGESLLLKSGILRQLERFDEALATVDLLLAAAPLTTDAHMKRGDILRSLNQNEAALDSYRRALELNPDDPVILGTVVYYQLRLCDWSGLDAARSRLLDKAHAGEATVIPFASLLLFDDASAQLKIASKASERYRAAHARPVSAHPRSGKLKIGYFSADFRGHAVTHLVRELLELHDRDRFEVTAFAFPIGKVDRHTDRVKASVDRYLDIRTMSDGEVVRLAHEMPLDVAIDLMGHTRGGRLGLFANRVAPIQVNYLGYPGTVGSSVMDYIVADRMIIPPEAVSGYSEKVVWLPGYYAPRDTTATVPFGGVSRADEGLADDAIVYCSFNQPSKLMPETFADWMAILAAVNHGVLWLLDAGTTVRDNLRRAAATAGIDPARLVFAPHRSQQQHLERLRLADLCLDNLPYNAHTTASDALYVGVPILTVPGSTFASRVCASIVTAAGLSELAAPDRPRFVARAIELGRDPVALAELRARLAGKTSQSRLFDTRHYARSFESALLRMHDRHQQGLAPDHIAIV